MHLIQNQVRINHQLGDVKQEHKLAVPFSLMSNTLPLHLNFYIDKKQSTSAY
ncbi:hypothetical protein KSB_56910 [Ktedonobacter robiniae]|uniref:Uncharacterized protein n=1 Tax=Ktedonobacter robiniae TaxID=2778365 RepID=A0ABQ3UWJ1_9CHLR|nr:hypothetical protein KSB_56910 [Ktedonobacter robiniae]